MGHTRTLVVCAALFGTSLAAAAPARAQPAASSQSDTTDHDAVTGRLGLRLFGAEGIGAQGVPGGLLMPVVGVRYWARPKMALEGGVGMLVAVPRNSGPNSVVGFRFHAGAPFVLGGTRHLTMLLVPNADLQYDTASKDVGIRLGGDLAAELQFGFWGLPQLSIQAQVGLALTNIGSPYVTLGTTAANLSPWDAFTSALSVTWYFGG